MKTVGLFIFFLLSTLLIKAQKITVAKDNSGNFTTIQAAVNSVKDYIQTPVEIYIKSGTYTEKLVIPAHKPNIKLIGEDKTNTIISFDDYSGKGNINTYTSYTVLVLGNGFEAQNITFQNTAGAVGQAVALHIKADRVVISNCNILGHQDTLFAAADTSRQYYRNCYIDGTTDFIFGAATAVFESCHIHSKKNSFITAASTTVNQRYGFVFFNCKLTADSAFKKVYLGRPWRPYAKTVFINTEMGGHIQPAGWSVWNQNDNHLTTYYAEYKSFGEGGDFSNRIAWSRQLHKSEVRKYTLKNIFNKGDNWWPSN